MKFRIINSHSEGASARVLYDRCNPTPLYSCFVGLRDCHSALRRFAMTVFYKVVIL